jgi:uncharacterized protein
MENRAGSRARAAALEGWSIVSSARRTAYVVCGSVALVVGVIGIIVPLLPTTPFLLLAAACYARGSQRLHDWLLRHPVLGEHIRDYRERRGLKRQAKIVALVALWAGIGFSMLAVDPLWVRLVLAVVALLVTAHIARLRTLPSAREAMRGR